MAIYAIHAILSMALLHATFRLHSFIQSLVVLA